MSEINDNEVFRILAEAKYKIDAELKELEPRYSALRNSIRDINAALCWYKQSLKMKKTDKIPGGLIDE